MRKVITAREAEELLRKGESAPADAILTPSARDLLSDHAKHPSMQGQFLHRFTGSQAKELSGIQPKLGAPDPREGLKECELCDTNEAQSGVVCRPPLAEQAAEPKADPELEAFIQRITDEILRELLNTEANKTR
jgi:hypothetical protein